MHAYIAAPAPVTPAWLTTVLRQSGVLRDGGVNGVENETTGAFNSHTSRLLVRYSDDATPDVPTRLILKRNIQEAWAIEAGRDEVKFYQRIASLPERQGVRKGRRPWLATQGYLQSGDAPTHNYRCVSPFACIMVR